VARPYWCINTHDLYKIETYKDYEKKPVATANWGSYWYCATGEGVNEIPTWGLPFLPARAGYGISIFIQLVFIAFMLARRQFRNPGKANEKIDLILMVMHVTSIINYAICIIGSENSDNAFLKFPWIASFLRPIEYGLMADRIRNYFFRYLNVIKRSFVMVCFILCYIAYFALLGNRLFE
jgi:hypothetical protein